MDIGLLLGGLAAALFGVYADLGFNLFSALNSSPQTTELFAEDRAETLWKYVKIADAVALSFGAFGSMLTYMSPQTRKLALWPMMGAVVVVVIMHLMYHHALNAGSARASGEGLTAANVFVDILSAG